MRVIGLVVVLIAAGSYAFRDYHRAPPPPPPEPELVAGPVTTTIAPPLDLAIADSASAKIAAGQHLAFPFSGGGRSGCHITGSVQTLTGGDHRVNVFVVDRDGLADVDAGRTPRTYYESGPTTDVALAVNVDGRTEYTLVVANAGSPARPKTVRLKSIRAACAD